MKQRTAAEVGAIVRQRRLSRGFTQENVPNVGTSTVKNIEIGKAPGEGRGPARIELMRALQWPFDALERLAAGEDPAALDQLVPPTSEAPPWDVLLGVMTEVRDEVRRLADDLEERR